LAGGNRVSNGDPEHSRQLRNRDRGSVRLQLSSRVPGTEVVVDFTSTTYIDSAALGMLLLLRDRVGDARQIRLANCKGQPDQVLRIANFHKLFRYDTQ